MPTVMTKFSYTHETWQKLARHPEDRSAPLKAAGGTADRDVLQHGRGRRPADLEASGFLLMPAFAAWALSRRTAWTRRVNTRW